MDPLMGPRLGHAKEQSLKVLGRIHVEVNQDEQQKVIRPLKGAFAPCAGLSLALRAFCSPSFLFLESSGKRGK